MKNVIGQLQNLGQSVWYDNISRRMLRSGELERLINLGVTGLTSNPTIFENAIAGDTDYDGDILKLVRSGGTADNIYEHLVVDDIRAAADLLRPVYDRTEGADGYASLEVNPHLSGDTLGTVMEAERLFSLLDRPNVMVKVPATPKGVPAIHRLIGQGINVNVTLTFSLDTYRDVRQAYISGLEDLDWSGGNLSKVASVASFFVSRVDTVVDDQIRELILDGNEDVEDMLGKAAIANAKLAYRDFKLEFSGERFDSLKSKGAMVQRPLWASTSTKNPDYRDVMYPESLMGPETVDTMPDATLEALLHHGEVESTLEEDVEDAMVLMEKLDAVGINMDQVTGNLLHNGVRAFTESFDSLMANIESKRTKFSDLTTDQKSG